MSLEWDRIAAAALALDGTELSTSYGAPAVKVNGRVIVSVGREPDSFVLHVDLDTVDMLMATAPDSYWQTPHYAGWPAVLVRYASPDPSRVCEMIGRARDWQAARKPPRRRG